MAGLDGFQFATQWAVVQSHKGIRIMWEYVVLFIVALVLAFAAMPKPQSQPAPGLGEVKAPTAEEGREIGVLFGTRLCEGPNVVWYGDIKTEAIRK
jgi:hypothetical protein